MITNSVQRYGKGMNHVFVGLGLIKKHPRLFLLSLIPFIIDLGLLIVGFNLGWGRLSGWADGLVLKMVAADSWLYSIVYYPLWIVFVISFLILLLFGVFVVASFVASPFNALLAEETLKILNKIEDKPFKMGEWIKFSIRMVMVSVVKAAIFTLIGLLLFAVSFVPGLNVVAAFCSCLIIAFDNADYSYEVLGLGLKERFARYKLSLAEFSGAASFLVVTVMVPGLTILLLPAAVVGSAALLTGSKE